MALFIGAPFVGTSVAVAQDNDIPAWRLPITPTVPAPEDGHYFADDDILHRESCAPKPEPDGVELLLRRWNSERRDTVMVGDYLFDLQAGKNAGTATIYIDCSGQFEWSALADISVANFASLLPLPKSTVC